VVSETFEELTQRIENSQLLAYVFESKQLRFQLFHMKSVRLYSFAVPTDTVHGRTVSTTPARSLCSIRLSELERRLDIRHNRYFPPEDPKLLLNDARERITLAYGRRRDEYRWLVNLQGEYPLLSFLVGDLSEIRWEVE
jgi:hypothetical protein